MSWITYKLVKKVILSAITIIGFKTIAFSCSTPVFRYALEMWPAYSYVVEIIHDGDLNSNEQQAFDLLKTAANSEISTNLKIVEKPHTNTSGADGAFIKMAFPEELNIPGTIWQGPLTTKNAEKIINSPSRKQALQNIQRGDAAVWLFLESGNTIRDDRQFDILKVELVRLSKTLKLSETATDVSGKLLDIKVINTGVNLSLVRINRNDPMEEVFISILLHTEADLQYFKNAPLAFPMFGQGRVLYALVGNGIKSENVERACSTIIGWCSCTIKDDNPGTDLLFTANWDGIIGDSSWIQQVEIPDITGISGFISDEVENDEMIEFESETAENVTSTPEIELEERLAADAVETAEQIEKEPELALESVKVNNEILHSYVSKADQSHEINPLLRNSLITFALILVIITAILFILKRK